MTTSVGNEMRVACGKRSWMGRKKLILVNKFNDLNNVIIYLMGNVGGWLGNHVLI